MINKLYYLTTVSLKRKICTKWFIIANVVLAILLVGITNIDSIIKMFGGDFNKKTIVYVIDNTNESYEILKSSLEATEKSVYDDVKYKIKKFDKSEKKLKKLIKDEDKKLGIIINSSEDNYIDIKLISNSYIETIDYQVLYQAINSAKTNIAIIKSNISQEELNKIYKNVNIERIILDEEKTSEEENIDTIMSTVFPVFILPFFMLIVFLVQMIGSEINDEKTTRGMEIIISNVSPKAHFFSKVLAGNIFVLMQAGLLLIYGGIGLLIRKIIGSGSIINMMSGTLGSTVDVILKSEFITKIIYIIPLALILMILTFLAYSLLAGILASMTTNVEDFNQLQTPIMVVSLAGYYLAMMAGFFKGSLLIRIFSYIPLISAILAPSLLILNQIGIIDIIISIILLILFNYILIKYGLRIYKVGILNYSSTNLWKKVFKSLKDK